MITPKPMDFAQITRKGKLHRLTHIFGSVYPNGWINCGAGDVGNDAKLFAKLEHADGIARCLKCFPMHRRRRRR